MTIHEMQNLNRATIEYASTAIIPGMTLAQLRQLCEEYMLSHGADSFWYWDVGAFVFAGDKTAVSVSGREYKTDDHIIETNDIITIDLSPQNNYIWGDYARTLIVENCRIVKDIEQIQNNEWRNGLKTEEYLHDVMCKFVTPKTTFEELYYYLNSIIIEKGYINLDFMGNLGHSIVKRKEDRIYIEKGNTARFGDVSYFTFEPHISVRGSKYGYKKENIYYFENGELKEL